MSNEVVNKIFTDLRKHLWGWIFALLSVSADSLAIFQFLQGHRGEFTLALFAIGISSLWLFSFYIYRKKEVVTNRFTDATENQPIFPKLARRIAFIGIFVIPILAAAGFFGRKYYQSLPSDKIIILVADFEGPDPKNYRVTETIIERLREATEEFDDVWVHPLGEAITTQQGDDYAHSKGKECKASVVLWGWYGKSEEKALVTIHFEVLQKPRSLHLRKEKEVLSVAIAELKSFKVQLQLSKAMSYLTLLTIGLARYEAQDYEGAIARFNIALTQSIVPIQMVHPAAIYFYRGISYYFMSDLDRAIADYNHAIILQPRDDVAYYNRGNVYYFKGNYERAIADYDQAIKLKSEEAPY